MAVHETIDRLETKPDHLEVWLRGTSEPVVIPWFWVRDHSRDPASFDAHTAQRTVDTFAIDLDCAAVAAEVVGGEVHVDWADGSPPSILPADVLISLPDATAISTAAGRRAPSLWSTGADVRVTAVPFTALVDDGEGDGLGTLLDDLAEFGFGIVSDVTADQAGTEALANAIGYVRRSIFGDVWPLSSDLTDHADSAYGQATLEPHTDGSYCHDGPGIQLFVCAERTGSGGESVLVDGFAAAARLKAEDPRAFELLSTIAVPAHYREPGVELRAARPTIRLEGDAVAQVTFNNYDRSPFLLPADTMLEWYRAYSAFHSLIVDERSWWTGRLEPGDALVFDNWRCLHGRLAFTGKRSFFGCYLNHEDLESRQRVRRRADKREDPVTSAAGK